MSYNTKILKVDGSCINFSPTAHIDGSLPQITDAETEQHLLEAAKIINNSSETVAFPTETVYGLGGSSLDDESVRNIYKAKNRPSDNPLISHFSSIEQLNRKIFLDEGKGGELLRNIPTQYHQLINKLWPGPLTILLPVPKNSPLSKLTTGAQPTFAARIPSNPIARALIAISDTPIAAPSANASTRPSPTLAEHVLHDLNGRIPLILDGGACQVGVESTVVDGLVSPPMLLRPGGFTYEEILELGGPEWSNCVVENKLTVKSGEKVRTPGMKYKHYAPKATTVLYVPEHSDVDMQIRLEHVRTTIRKFIEDTNKGKKVHRIGILCSINFPFDILNGIGEFQIVAETLGQSGKSIQNRLFAQLRKLDEQDNVDLIVIEGISENEEGLAIMNRLRKAANGNIFDY